jgi:enoyl-CoA hydratase/carnithine racemase
MDYEEIDFEIREAIAIITLDRPDRLNAFTGTMGRELGSAYRRCDRDDRVRAVVVTGAGRAFCAGADLGGGGATFERRDEASFSAAGVDPPAWAVRKPVIAAVNGHAVGIGLTLALQCDLRVMAREGSYGILQVRRGVMPDAYAHWTLPRLVGIERAADLLLTGRKIFGDEAGQIGLAARVLPAPEVVPCALAIAREIAENAAPLSVAITKRLLWESANLSRGEVGERETALHHHLMGRSDAREGIMAYLERRPPRWESSVNDDWPDWPEGSGEPDTSDS